MIDDVLLKILNSFTYFVKNKYQFDLEIRDIEKNKITYIFKTSVEAHLFYFVIYNDDTVCHITQTVVHNNWSDKKLYKDSITYKASIYLSDSFWNKEFEFFNLTLDDWFFKKIKDNKPMSNNIKDIFMREHVKIFWANKYAYIVNDKSVNQNVDGSVNQNVPFIEDSINEFLNNPNIKIIRVLQSTGENYLTISIFYQLVEKNENDIIVSSIKFS